MCCRRAIVSRVVLDIQGVCWNFAISFGQVIYDAVSYSKARVSEVTGNVS